MKSLKEMTFEEKMLRHIICGMRDVIIGGFENTYNDCGEEQAEECWPLKDRTKETVVNDILSQIFDGKESYVVSPIDFTGLEKKHILNLLSGKERNTCDLHIGNFCLQHSIEPIGIIRSCPFALADEQSGTVGALSYNIKLNFYLRFRCFFPLFELRDRAPPSAGQAPALIKQTISRDSITAAILPDGR